MVGFKVTTFTRSSYLVQIEVTEVNNYSVIVCSL